MPDPAFPFLGVHFTRTPDGRLEDDFHITETHSAIHVLNAPSPAATASFAIGEHIAGVALQRF